MGAVLRAALIGVLVLLPAVTCAPASEVLRKVLSSPLVEEGSDPDGCDPAVSGFGGPSVWHVRLERFLLDGKALVEESHEANLNRFPLCVADRPLAKNAEVELSFVAHEGGIAHIAGVVLRFADPQDFYVVEADASAGRVRLLRILNGERHEIAGRAAALALGAAHSLRTKAVDESFGIALDGKPLFEVSDRGLTAPGRFGVWSRADSETRFGDLFITILD